MKTMGIEEAAEFLMVHPVTLYKMAERGEVPAAKPGKRWVFIDVDLVDWIRSKYALRASVSDLEERSNTCHFTNEKAQKSGGLSLLMQQESAYKDLLGLK